MYIPDIPGGSNPTNVPTGSGFGTVAVDSAGKVTLKGTLADGTAIAQRTTISRNGEWPLYVAINKGKGSVLSWVGLANGTPKSFRGDLSWTRLADPLATTYPAGFILDTSIHGSQYTPPLTGNRILNYSFPFIRFNGANFDFYRVTFTLGTDNKISNPDPSGSMLTLKFTTSSGLFSGTVLDPATLKSVSFKGVVDQIGQDGYGTGNGFFLQSSQSGSVFIWVED
jgi:hypothetical protein